MVYTSTLLLGCLAWWFLSIFVKAPKGTPWRVQVFRYISGLFFHKNGKIATNSPKSFAKKEKTLGTCPSSVVEALSPSLLYFARHGARGHPPERFAFPSSRSSALRPRIRAKWIAKGRCSGLLKFLKSKHFVGTD